MIIDILLNGLNHPTPALRIETIRVLAMLEETKALPALRARFPQETDPEVQQALKWAGSLIYKAEQKGYSTDLAIAHYFRLHLNPTEEEKREQEKLAEIQRKMELQNIKDKQNGTGRTLKTSLALGAIGAAVGGPMLGAQIMIQSQMQGMISASAETYENRPAIGAQAIIPQKPSNQDISVWVKRLGSENLETRKGALIELKTINNPAALPQLAHYFVFDPNEEFKLEVQRTGKIIYYNWTYSEQYEAMKAEEEAKKKPETPQKNEPSAAEILAKAQAARDARNSKRTTRS